jgi:adenine-specific DNA methylase
LAACRAVICAALWPDPADPNCPQAFRDAAARQIMGFARRADGDLKVLATSSEEGKARWAALVKSPMSDSPTDETDLLTLRAALLDFIADFANWDNSTVPEYLATSRALTQSAHEALGGAPGTRPLVVDPFAGGRSIPLEALRVGADAFASDLNPIPVLLNKVVLEYIPKYGQRLADEVRKWGRVDQGAGREGTGGVLSKGSRRRHADRVPLGADDPVRRRKVAVTELRRLVGLGFLTVSGERRGVRYGPGPALRL